MHRILITLHHMKRLSLTILLLSLPLAAFAGSYTFSTTGLDEISHGQAATWNLKGTSYTNLLTEFTGTNKVVTGATLKLYDPRDWQAEAKDVLYINVLKGLDINTPYVDIKTYDSNPSQNDTVYGLNAFDDSSGARNNNLHNAGLLFTDAATGSLLKSTDADMPADLPGTWTDTTGPYGQGANLAQISDVTIQFTGANLNILNSYLVADEIENMNGDSWGVGLGLAAECHYYFSNVVLTITVGDAPTVTQHSVPDTASTLVLAGAAVAGLVGLRRRLSRV